MTKCTRLLATLTLPTLLFFVGCDLSDSGRELDITGEEVRTEAATQESSSPSAETPATENVGGGWRDGRDVGVISASNGVVEWETLNVQAPTSPNRPGDAEWIIARIEGQGFSRLLIMTMHTSGGRRSPSRIFLEGPGGGFSDGRFPVPLNGVNRWRVQSSDGALRVFLNNREIWSAAGNFRVDRAVMCDSPARGFLGQWRAVQ